MLAVPISKDISRLFRQEEFEGTRDASDHITLFYFGDELPIGKAVKIIQAVYEVTQDLTPFSVSCKRITTFPKGENGYPTIAKLDSAELIELRNRLAEIFEQKGIQFDKTKEFNPHVTLSYYKHKEKNVSFPKVQWMVNEVALFGGDRAESNLYVSFPFSLGIEKAAAYIDVLAGIFKEAVIKKQPSGKYRVQSMKGKNLGEFDSKEKAKKRLKQIEYFKYLDKNDAHDEKFKEDGKIVTKLVSHGK